MIESPPAVGYSILYADPPWQFKDKNRNGNRGAGCKYDTMGLDELKALPVPAISANDCTLFMWHVPAMPSEALALVESWGFQLKTMKAFSWVKLNPKFMDNLQKHFRVNALDLQSMTDAELLPLLLAATKMGLGHWTRGNTEDCLIAVRGKPKRISGGVRQLIIEPIREHSRKPDTARQRIVQLMGDVPRLELFARTSTPGWDVWGNQIDQFTEAA